MIAGDAASLSGTYAYICRPVGFVPKLLTCCRDALWAKPAKAAMLVRDWRRRMMGDVQGGVGTNVEWRELWLLTFNPTHSDTRLIFKINIANHKPGLE
jgi:hypothetical protein